jgi:glycosyltransferase involved in cell wall biosynthesis
MSPPSFSVVIPCFNEEAAVEGTVRDICEALRDAGAYELVVVDDGSTDATGDILARLTEDVSELVVVRHDTNRGYGAALKSGIRRAESEIIVIADADGSYPLNQIPALLELSADADMVVGARTGENVTYSWLRRIPKSVLTRYCSWISRTKIPDINSGMRVFKKSVFEKYTYVLPDGFSFTTTITVALLTNGHVVRFWPIDYSARIGKSKIRPIRDTLAFFQLILRTGIYFAPLRAFAPVLLIFALGFASTLGYDIFINENITDKTLILLTFTLNIAFFALLADLIDKRLGR